MDNNLLLVLVGTGVISLLTLVYVLVDESIKKRRYQAELVNRPPQDPPLAKDPDPIVPAAADLSSEATTGSEAEIQSEKESAEL